MRSRRSRGYTVVELMMALAVMAIGLSGVIAMQKVTLSSNGHARKLALATRLGQSWLDELAADAGQWNDTNDFDAFITWPRDIETGNGVVQPINRVLRPIDLP